MYLCMGCMAELNDSLNTCPYCGYKRGTPPEEAYHLPPETILNGRYIVGKALRHDGSAITYIALDCAKNKNVAIQEFYPQGFVCRASNQKKVVVNEKDRHVFQAHQRRFLEEDGLWLALQGVPGAWQTLHIFSENETVYIVREYFSHCRSLKDEIQAFGAVPIFERTAGMLLPVIAALCVLHSAGLVHRDINPNCIFLTERGIKICPTGCVTHMSKGRGIVLSPGFSAPEMYRARTKVTASADVYSICAVLYYVLTGQVPPEAVDRLQHDTLHPSAELGARGAHDTVLQHGMALRREKRIQTIDELIDLFPGIVIDAYNRQKAMIQNKE